MQQNCCYFLMWDSIEEWIEIVFFIWLIMQPFLPCSLVDDEKTKECISNKFATYATVGPQIRLGYNFYLYTKSINQNLWYLPSSG